MSTGWVLRAPTTRHLGRQAAVGLFAVAMLAGWWVIAEGSVSYFEEGLSHPFLQEKEGLGDEELYLLALQVHVVSAAWSLPACLVLTWRRVLRTAPRVHRWLGRITAAVVLVSLVPSGAFLSLEAKGGLPGTLGFLLSGGIAAFAMVRAVRTAMARDFVAHRRWTLHVVAQLSVAVSSRAMLIAFDAWGVDEIRGYLIALWVPVVASAVLAESTARPVSKERKSHENVDAIAVSLDPAR
jgi:hypothetical protein